MAALSTQLTRVRYPLNDPNSTLHTDAFLMEAYNRIIQDFLNPFLIDRKSYYAKKTNDITLVDGTENYSMESDCLAPIDFWMNTETWKLTHIRNSDDRNRYPGDGGTPYKYTLLNGQVYFFDAKPGTGTVDYDYWALPALFTATTGSMPYNDLLNTYINELVVYLVRNDEEKQVVVEQGLWRLLETRLGAFLGTAGSGPHETRDTGDFNYD